MTYEETDFLFGSEMTLPKSSCHLSGEGAEPAEDTGRVASCVTALGRLSLEVNDYKMFTNISSGTGWERPCLKCLIIKSEKFDFFSK